MVSASLGWLRALERLDSRFTFPLSSAACEELCARVEVCPDYRSRWPCQFIVDFQLTLLRMPWLCDWRLIDMHCIPCMKYSQNTVLVARL